MSLYHPVGDALKQLRKDEKKRIALDSARREAEKSAFDGAGPDVDYAATDIALKAVGAIHEWAETPISDLDDGETLSNRLAAMFVGIADADKDGELSDDESDVVEAALEAAWSYLSKMGASDEDIDLLLNEWDADAAARVQELVAGAMPEGEDAAGANMDDFAFGDGSDESAFDAVYKLKTVVRAGKKMRINKRIAGTVRLSAKQKVSIKKATRKAQSAVAQMRRLKSNRVRRKMGI